MMMVVVDVGGRLACKQDRVTALFFWFCFFWIAAQGYESKRDDTRFGVPENCT
jgi:hypothetical protein